MINISLQSEYVFNFFGLFLTNSFLTSVLVCLLLAALGLLFFFRRKNRNNFFIGFVMVIVFELLKFIDNVTQDREFSKKILPLIATLFLFIISANVLSLIPGFLGSFFIETRFANLPVLRSPNSDLTLTISLALISVIGTQFFSFRILGIKKYLRRFLNFDNPIKFISGFFGIISDVVKVFSFSFRLFGNIFAGEVLLLIVAFLVPYIIPLPFMILELFVGVIQAFIFAILTLIFIKTSIIKNQ